ncbi:MAG TPA: hypothetical protein VMV20_01115 [Chitinophagaceae bacterium]|nr:hypothetical protein [Chitinophagaceae bacterium]
MRRPYIFTPLVAATALVVLGFLPVRGQNAVLSVRWNKVVRVSQTTATLQVVANPMLRRNSPIHQGTFRALRELGADFVRYVPWFPYPHLAVAELRAPTRDSTFWDFSKTDPLMEDLMEATSGHTTVINFSTIPAWMFQTDHPIPYPADPDLVSWGYSQGTRLRDTTLKELTGYYSRLLMWYTLGGFRDEHGVFHRSGHHYQIPYWEVLNEPDLEHNFSPETYTRIYDSVVLALRKVSPHTRFVGMAVAFETNPQWFEYFLDPAHHKAGVLPDGISYHFYGTPDAAGLSLDQIQYCFFDQANDFLDKVRYIESIRLRLAPKTFTDVDELGNILGDSYTDSIPPGYWNLSGAMFAYTFLELQRMGIDVVGESQLVGYPTQYPDVSMMDWTNGKPNSRYWVLKLIRDNLGPGDTLVATGAGSDQIAAQAYRTNKGKKLLVINKRNQAIHLRLSGVIGTVQMDYVDQSTGENPPARTGVPAENIPLAPFSVALINLRGSSLNP